MTGDAASVVDDEGIEWIVIKAPASDVARYLETRGLVSADQSRQSAESLLGYWIAGAYYRAHPEKRPTVPVQRRPRSRDWGRP